MGTVERTFQIVEEVVAHQERGLSFSEVVSRTHLPKASAHRILKALVHVGYLRFDEEGSRYYGDLRLSRLGSEVTAHFDLKGYVRPRLLRLHTETGHTCHLGIRSGEVGTYLDKLGFRSSDTVGLMLKDVWLPEECLLGELNQGFIQAKEVLAAGRIGVAAMAVGIGRACLEESIDYARKRQAFGRPIADFQAIQWMLADMATELDAARLLVYRAAMMKDGGKRFTREASMAKLFASEAAMRGGTRRVAADRG